tara:strand:+ start:4369 stop:4875 length:507 start_codon:yes stop_codon:yes gene_type:complete
MSANTSIAPPAAAPTKTAKVSAPRSPRSVLIAGYAVLVPLVAMAMVVVTTYPANGTDAVLRVEITYAAALLSFVGGIRWGIALMAGAAHLQWKPLTFITAALPLAWAILFMSPPVALAALMAGYLLIAFGERLGSDNPVPHWYRALFMPFTVMIEIGLGLSLITILSV